MSKFGVFSQETLVAVQAEANAVVTHALNAVKAATTAKGKATANVASLNRDVAVCVIRAVCGGFIGSRGKDVEKGTLGHTLQAHGQFGKFKATVSQARSMAEFLTGPNAPSIVIPETKSGENGWTLAGASYEEGDTLAASVIVAGLVNPKDGDTSPLNLAKTIAKMRGALRATEEETKGATLEALGLYLASEHGEGEAAKKISAEDIFVDGRDETGEFTAETLAKIETGKTLLAARDARLAVKTAQGDTVAYVAGVVGFIASDKMTAENAAQFEAALSLYRAKNIQAPIVAQVDQAAQAA